MSAMNDQTQQQVVKELDFVSQNAHMLTGAFIVFVFIIFHLPLWLWYVIPSYIALTTWKEFYYDQRNEIPEIRGSNARDFLFYNIGWVGALVLYFIAEWIK